jgi:multiple sugar transport system permease protein
MATTLEKPLDTAYHKPLFRHFTIGKLLVWILLAAMAILFLIPFVWMLSTSLKTPQELQGYNWIPQTMAFENYQQAFSYGQWTNWFSNSIIITVLTMIGMVLSSAIVAYSFARLRWRGRDWLFSIVLATMMLPGVVILIPQFILFSKMPAFGLQNSRVWVNTFLPLIIPAWTGNAFNIFLIRQFMRSIPIELSEAAKIDGASELRIFWDIILPLTKPALATVAIFTFQGAWEDFMGPLLYLQSDNLYTIQLGLRQFEAAAGGAPAWNWLMAASLVCMLPLLIIYLIFQRYFIEGIQLSGLTGR